MAEVKVEGLNKIYDNGFQAVYDFNIDIRDGEFIVLVGPSGCGKSTSLRMIAGLEEISTGKLLIDGKNMTNTAPKDRDIAMVFQNYALYAHMTVYQNMAFPLTMRKVNPAEIHERVIETAKILGLLTQLNKKPKNLSGGQRQRVALGRAIVRDPKVFLFDEPLSNLDAKLRGQTRRELKLLHQKMKSTIIYVTHDQIEALTLADRIVCMSIGRVQQIGTPLEIYSKPANLFVAGFIGLPPMNFFDMEVAKDGMLKSSSFIIQLKPAQVELLKDYVGKQVVLGVRPEHGSEGQAIDMTVENNENLGHYTFVHGKLNGKKVVFKFSRWCDYDYGDKIKIDIDLDKIHFFDKETTNAIR